MSAALATLGLNKAFGSLVVSSDIAFSLPKGERYALIGPNGAGKTTLINLLTGMLKPDGGQILLDGQDITALPPAARVEGCAHDVVHDGKTADRVHDLRQPAPHAGTLTGSKHAGGGRLHGAVLDPGLDRM